MMKVLGRIVGVIALFVVLAGVYFLEPEGERSRTIKIGIVAPMTGTSAQLGEGWVSGAELAIHDVNSEGSIGGKKVELVIEDSKCILNSGASVFSKLIFIDKVVAIVGPLCSSTAAVGLQIAQEEKTPTIIAAPEFALTKTGDYIFRNYPSDSSQALFAADYIFNTLGVLNVGVLYVQNDWGIELQEAFVEEFERLGGIISAREGVLQDAIDVRTSLTKVLDAEPDLLYLPLYPQSGAIALQQLDTLFYRKPIIGTDVFSADEIFSIPEAEGVIITLPKTDADINFNYRVHGVTERETNEVSGYAYDAVMMIGKALREVGTDKKAIRDYLDNLIYTDSVSVSEVSFDQNGDLEGVASWAAYRVKEGKLIQAD